MVATAGVEDCPRHNARSSCLVPSVNMPVAVNCWVVPAAICGLVGVTSITASWKGRMLIVTGVPVGRISAVVLPIKVGIEDPERKCRNFEDSAVPYWDIYGDTPRGAIDVSHNGRHIWSRDRQYETSDAGRDDLSICNAYRAETRHTLQKASEEVWLTPVHRSCYRGTAVLQEGSRLRGEDDVDGSGRHRLGGLTPRFAAPES